MEELTVEEIIRYAIRIEEESYLFYREVSKRLDKTNLKSLTDELCNHAVEHLCMLKRCINEEHLYVDENDLSATIDLDTSSFDMIIHISSIPAQATALDILNIAINRERGIEYTYDMIKKLSRVCNKIKKLFGALKESESSHVIEIKSSIASIRSTGYSNYF